MSGAGRDASKRYRPRLVIMVKAPVAGAVKTRLARSIGTARAASFYRHAVRCLINRLAGDRRWETRLAITPDNAVLPPHWPGPVLRLDQGPGDLGDRMDRIFARLPPGPVVIVGTDIPEIAAAHIAAAFALLGAHDAVFGPAADGGYWLVGLRRRPRVPAIFEGVRWSSARTLADTLANLRGQSVGLLDVLDDVDEKTSYRRLKDAGSRVVPPRPRVSGAQVRSART